MYHMNVSRRHAVATLKHGSPPYALHTYTVYAVARKPYSAVVLEFK